MTDLNRLNELLNSTSAGAIAKKLDSKDGSEDKKISGSIWNKFIEQVGTGTQISATGSISVYAAMNSITKYVINAAKQAGKQVKVLAHEWNVLAKDMEGAPASEASNSQETQQDENDGTTKAKNSTGQKVSYSEIKTTVPKYLSEEAKAYSENQKSGFALADSIKQGSTKGLTKENVAYAKIKSNVQFGPNSQRQAKTVFQLLASRLHDLFLFDSNKDIDNVDKFSQLTYKEQNNLITQYSNRINAHEKDTYNKSLTTKNNQSKAQATFNAANEFLVDMANMDKSEYTITSGKDKKNRDTKTAKLPAPDSRYIKVTYNSNDEIIAIWISHDTTPETKSDGTLCDTIDVVYSKNLAMYDSDTTNNEFEGSITSGYDFEKLKKIAEKIFE